ncbi:MAG: YkvA family protein [Gammaproteobacteria bacterium]
MADITSLPVPRQYSETRFRDKLARAARAAGHEVIEKALWLYFAAQNPATPKWAKATVYGALAYFIMPLDAIPDLAPVAGYTDDLGVLAVAVATIARYIDEGVKQKTTGLLSRWFQ